MKKIILLVIFAALGNMLMQGQNNTVIIHQSGTPQVIEKPVYIERYRTVYVDKPQPKRIAKILSAPIKLVGYLWVYPEDLGNFKQQPISVIAQVNKQKLHGHDNWRIPTPDELALLEANADKVGLGDDIYMATDQSNGVLRLVCIEGEETEKQKEQRMAEEKAKFYVEINGLKWAKYNVGSKGIFVSSPENYGRYYTYDEALTACPIGWHVPTLEEIKYLLSTDRVANTWTTQNGINGGKFTDKTSGNSIFLPAAGYLDNNDGSTGYYWSSTDSKYPYALYFNRRSFPQEACESRSQRLCVRCVCDE